MRAGNAAGWKRKKRQPETLYGEGSLARRPAIPVGVCFCLPLLFATLGDTLCFAKSIFASSIGPPTIIRPSIGFIHNFHRRFFVLVRVYIGHVGVSYFRRQRGERLTLSRFVSLSVISSHGSLDNDSLGS